MVYKSNIETLHPLMTKIVSIFNFCTMHLHTLHVSFNVSSHLEDTQIMERDLCDLKFVGLPPTTTTSLQWHSTPSRIGMQTCTEICIVACKVLRPLNNTFPLVTPILIP